MAFYGSWIPARLRGRRHGFRVIKGGLDGRSPTATPDLSVVPRARVPGVSPGMHLPKHGMPMGPDPKFCTDCAAPLAKKVLREGESERLVCSGCDKVAWLDPKVAAGIIATWQGGVVLVRRAHEPGFGKWVFPGGFVDRGERVSDAAQREAYEEARMKVEGLSLMGVYSYADSPVVLVTYRPTRVLTAPDVGDDEVSEVRVFPLDRIPWDQLAFRSTVDALKDFVRMQKGVSPHGGQTPA